MAEVLNITFIKRQSTDETLDVICVNGMANGLVYPYTGNTLSLMFPTGNTYVSTFDGGSQGFKILSDHISRVTGNLISQTIINNLQRYYLYQEKGSGLTHDEELFIEKLKEFGKTISTTTMGELNNTLLTFARDLKTTYNNDDFKNSSIPKIEQFLKNNGDIQKILTDNFNIKGADGFTYGKGTVALDPMFKKLFPYRSSSGGQHRRTRKKQI
jgi:hypothetical protein